MSTAEEQLWENHTFRILLDDMFKARKDTALGPVRLKVVLDYLDGWRRLNGGATPAAVVARQAAPVNPIPGLPETDTDDEIVEETAPAEGEEEAPAKSRTKAEAYVDQMRAQRPPTGQRLAETAAYIAKQVKKRGWSADGTITIELLPGMPTPGLKPALRDAGVAFTELSVGVPATSGVLGSMKDSGAGISEEAAASAARGGKRLQITLMR